MAIPAEPHRASSTWYPGGCKSSRPRHRAARNGRVKGRRKRSQLVVREQSSRLRSAFVPRNHTICAALEKLTDRARGCSGAGLPAQEIRLVRAEAHIKLL